MYEPKYSHNVKYGTIIFLCLLQVMSGGISNGSLGDDSLILLDDLDKQVELDASLMAPLAKLIASSKVIATPVGCGP